MVLVKVNRYPRLAGLLFFASVLVVAQVTEQIYLWYVHREDRMHLVELREELVDMGAEMIDAQLHAQRIRDRLDLVDRTLHATRRDLDAYVYHASGGALPARLFHTYHSDLDAFNARLRERNTHLDDLNEAIVRRNAAARRYHLLADSIRGIASRAREPYFAIPLPAEAAVERGVHARPAGELVPSGAVPAALRGSAAQ